MTASGGLYDGFEGYRTPTYEELDEAVRSAIVVLDTNVLLNLYNYQGRALDDFIRVFEALGDRLFVPHQAMDEFWRNRITALKENQGKYREEAQIRDSFDRIEREFRSWYKRVVDRSGEPPIDAKRELREARDAVLEYIAEQNLAAQATTAETPTHEDRVLRRLEPLLRDRVGPALSTEQRRALLVEGESRVKARVPPGYMDAQKSPDRAIGDFLVWRSAMEEARARSLPLVLVTDDLKEDWWSDPGRLPRPEMVEELRTFCGQGMWMIRGHDLVGRGDALGVEVSELTVDQAEAVQESDSLDDTGSNDAWTAELASDYLSWLWDWPDHYAVLQEAVDHDGVITRKRMARLLHKDPEVGMKGSGRPFNTALNRLNQERGLDGYLPVPLTAAYDGGWMTHFVMPTEAVAAFKEAFAAEGEGEAGSY